jgi:hypothetical protein
VSVLDEDVEIDLTTLDEAETGDDYTGSELVFLLTLGVAVPAVLLVVGLL